MKEQTFQHKDANYISNYSIWRENNLVFVEHYYCGRTVTNPTKIKFDIHAGNIPAAMEAIAFVFKAPMGRGESKDFSGYDETGFAIMGTERQIIDLSILVKKTSGDYTKLRFYFDRGEIPSEPNKRVYTPAMVWVMNAMQEEYDAWKKEQEKLQTNIKD